MKTQILLGVIATLSISGLALSDSIIPESGDGYIEKNVKEFNQDVSLIWEQAQSKFDPQGNDVERLRLKQVKRHLETAETYKKSHVFNIAQQELDYANSLLQLPRSEVSIGRL